MPRAECPFWLMPSQAGESEGPGWAGSCCRAGWLQAWRLPESIIAWGDWRRDRQLRGESRALQALPAKGSNIERGETAEATCCRKRAKAGEGLVEGAGPNPSPESQHEASTPSSEIPSGIISRGLQWSLQCPRIIGNQPQREPKRLPSSKPARMDPGGTPSLAQSSDTGGEICGKTRHRVIYALSMVHSTRTSRAYTYLAETAGERLNERLRPKMDVASWDYGPPPAPGPGTPSMPAGTLTLAPIALPLHRDNAHWRGPERGRWTSRPHRNSSNSRATTERDDDDDDGAKTRQQRNKEKKPGSTPALGPLQHCATLTRTSTRPSAFQNDHDQPAPSSYAFPANCQTQDDPWSFRESQLESHHFPTTKLLSLLLHLIFNDEQDLINVDNSSQVVHSQSLSSQRLKATNALAPCRPEEHSKICRGRCRHPGQTAWITPGLLATLSSYCGPTEPFRVVPNSVSSLWVRVQTIRIPLACLKTLDGDQNHCSILLASAIFDLLTRLGFVLGHNHDCLTNQLGEVVAHAQMRVRKSTSKHTMRVYSVPSAYPQSGGLTNYLNFTYSRRFRCGTTATWQGMQMIH
ncbi:hypothetical protein Micbo1qcDRAFT_210689 [Microdochium bolleyi]|uniref:Uncharacterized protein n=1 Tax=Microdochium bolleyi TaxID=196109 RepID=A0A136JGT7_9PEZI|nr:hypothetical protein Micbo1qcDRAFT_210689 [Microdochium bolleyi]